MDVQNVEEMNQDEHHSEEVTSSCSKLDGEQTLLPSHTNNQTMLQETTEAAKSTHKTCQETINEFIAVFKDIAQTGSISSYSWQDLKGPLVSMLEAVLQQYIDKSSFRSGRDDMKLIHQTRTELFGLIDIINELDDIPFTIQRISELLYEPFRYYDKADKFARAMEKNFRVVSGYEEPKPTVQQKQQQPPDVQQPELNNIESRQEMPDKNQLNNELGADHQKHQLIDNKLDKNDASHKPEGQQNEEPAPEVPQELPQPKVVEKQPSGGS